MKPRKIQLVTDCFLPINEDVLQWVRQKKGPYLAKFYNTKLIDEQEDWILLRGYLSQENDSHEKLDIFLNTLFIDNKNTDFFAEHLKKGGGYYNSPEFYYLFAGEIAWSRNIYYESESFEIESKDIEVLYPYSWYNWESYHSKQNNIGSFPFVSKQIAKNLIFNTKDLSFYDKNGKRCTKYIWDDYSHFLYIKKDILEIFMNDKKYELVWCETGTRYGEYGNRETKLNPSFMDFTYVEIFSNK